MRKFYMICTLAAGAMLSFSFFLQYYKQLAPCPLCILQRTLFIVLCLLFLCATLTALSTRMRTIWAVLIGICTSLGMLISGYHYWVQQLGAKASYSCGPDIAFIFAEDGIFAGIRAIFESPGTCSDIHWQLLGISIPGWAFISFSAFFLANILGPYFITKCKKTA